MADDDKVNILARVARTPPTGAVPIPGEVPTSVLVLAAASYGARPLDDATVPTGFDPIAVALFEAIVEGAYLVASADSVVDDEERRTFERVVVAACGGSVAPQAVGALVSDLADQLAEDGLDKRIAAVADMVRRAQHGREVLRVAALLASASGGVSHEEREVLQKLATALGLEAAAVEGCLDEVKGALAGG